MCVADGLLRPRSDTQPADGRNSENQTLTPRFGDLIGTTMQAWDGTTMEPFLTASLWGNLSEDDSACLASNGTTFLLEGDLEDIRATSTGVNLFNLAGPPSVFAKVDYTFVEGTQGIGGNGGIRFTW